MLDDDCAPLLTMKYYVKLCRSAAGESGGAPKGLTGKTRQNYMYVINSRSSSKLSDASAIRKQIR